jgi:hypothetical protein
MQDARYVWRGAGASALAVELLPGSLPLVIIVTSATGVIALETFRTAQESRLMSTLRTTNPR